MSNRIFWEVAGFPATLGSDPAGRKCARAAVVGFFLLVVFMIHGELSSFLYRRLCVVSGNSAEQYIRGGEPVLICFRILVVFELWKSMTTCPMNKLSLTPRS